jgi:hypothetical protein
MNLLWRICQKELGWAERARIEDIVQTGERYVSPALAGEAVLTLGGPVYEFERGHVQGVVIVGPHECMPCKISEARYARVAQDLGMPHVALSVSGDGIDHSALDRFAFDLRDQARIRTTARPSAVRPAPNTQLRRVSLPIYPSRWSSSAE